MNPEQNVISPSPFQLKLKDFCIQIESQFDKKIGRQAFVLRMLVAAVILGGICWYKMIGFPDAAGLLPVLVNLVLAVTFVWAGLQIIRRFHELERSGGLIWAILIPLWALWKINSHFPNLWIVWVILFGYTPVKLFIELFFKKGKTDAPD